VDKPIRKWLWQLFGRHSFVEHFVLFGLKLVLFVVGDAFKRNQAQNQRCEQLAVVVVRVSKS